MAQYRLVPFETYNLGEVEVVFGPVAGVIGVSACRIGEAEADGDMFARGDGCSDHILLGVYGGADLDRCAVNREIGCDEAVPHIELLVYGSDLVGIEPVESDCAQMQAVGIDTIVVGGILLASVLVELHGIGLLTPTAEIIILEGLLTGEVLGVDERVPSPLALGTQGHTVAIELGEALQACDIDGEGKLSIAHSERGKCVNRRDMRVVALNKRLTVYGGVGLGAALDREGGGTHGRP